MSLDIDELKKKIIYRSTYRGTKEMDTLISSFTKQIIDDLNYEELISLSNFLKIDDENLYKFHQGISNNISVQPNKISRLFKKFKYKKE